MRIYFTEGGNMFSDCVPINQENVAATFDDIDAVQKMWKAWKNSPAVRENPELIDEIGHQVERSASRSPGVQFPGFDGEEFINESNGQVDSK